MLKHSTQTAVTSRRYEKEAPTSVIKTRTQNVLYNNKHQAIIYKEKL